jgi:hypothetical protein
MDAIPKIRFDFEKVPQNELCRIRVSFHQQNRLTLFNDLFGFAEVIQDPARSACHVAARLLLLVIHVLEIVKMTVVKKAASDWHQFRDTQGIIRAYQDRPLTSEFCSFHSDNTSLQTSIVPLIVSIQTRQRQIAPRGVVDHNAPVERTRLISAQRPIPGKVGDQSNGMYAIWVY